MLPGDIPYTRPNEEKLCQLAEMQNMITNSTCFPHKTIHKGTWKIPGTTNCNQIDHVLINKRWATFNKGVHAFGGINCDSDHFLVTASSNQNIYRKT